MSQPAAAQWGGWESLGGVTLENSSCTTWSANRIDCFARGTDRAMWHRWWDGSRWGGWESLGGIILEEPECVSWGANRIDCFARGTDRAMWHRWWDGNGWGGWENLGGTILEQPSCTTWSANRIDCFARGTDRAMWHRWWDGSRWGGWESLGGIILEHAECRSWSANRIDCFARGTDRAMWHRWWDGSRWGGWESLGGIILEQPTCVTWASNRLDCFGRGTDSALWHRWWPCPGCDNTVHQMTVRRFNTAALTNGEADGIFNDAGTVLQTNDGSGDRACAVAWARSGNVGVFTDGDGSIDSQAEFNALIGLAGNVKVVNQINWCGGLIPNVIGCARVPGNSLAVVRIGADEGILFAHEFGHNKGLSHRNDDANAVMNGTIGNSHRRVTASECDSFRVAAASAAVSEDGPPQAGSSAETNDDALSGVAMPTGMDSTVPATLAASGEDAAQGNGMSSAMTGERVMPDDGAMRGTSSMSEAASVPTGMKSTTQSDGGVMPGEADASAVDDAMQPVAGMAGDTASLPDVRDFVRQIFVEGVPFDQASRYDASAVPTLLAMLNDPAEERWWPNIVVVLGMIGDDSAVAPMIAFAEADVAGRISREHYAAKTSAIMSLGYIVNRSGNRQALDFLTASLDPKSFEALDDESVAPFQSDVGERNADFSKFAAFGLALSGRPEAAAALRAQRVSPPAPATESTVSTDVIDQALEENDEIARDGLEAYYSRERRR